MNQWMNKKALQSNANHPLADSLGYLMNKFEHVSAGGGGPDLHANQ